MRFFVVTTALASAVPAVLGLTINTPTGVVQCQPIMLTFGSGIAPYYVSAIPGGQVSAVPLRTWDPTNSGSITWNVDIASGTSLSFVVKDSTGAQAYSDSVIIQPSGDSSCLNASSSGTATHASSAPAATNGDNASHAGSTQGPTATAAARTTAAPGSSSNAANSVSRASGGQRQLEVDVAQLVIGAVGVMGALIF